MRRLMRLVFALALVGSGMLGAVAWGKKPPPPPPPGGGTGCPRDVQCLDVWNPVVCADGITYSNDCYAFRACAPGPCTPAADVQ